MGASSDAQRAMAACGSPRYFASCISSRILTSEYHGRCHGVLAAPFDRLNESNSQGDQSQFVVKIHEPSDTRCDYHHQARQSRTDSHKIFDARGVRRCANSKFGGITANVGVPRWPASSAVLNAFAASEHGLSTLNGHCEGRHAILPAEGSLQRRRRSHGEQDGTYDLGADGP
jgi:hypothetical protein